VTKSSYRWHLAALVYLVAGLFSFLLTPGEVKAAPAFVKAESNKLTLNGQPITLKGSSFYPHEGPWQYMWTQWNGEATAQDLAHAVELGNNTVRILVPYGGTYGWIDDNTGEVRAEYLNQLKQMVQIAGNLNLRVILTLFDFYGMYPAAGSLEERSNLNYLRTIISAFRDDDRILAWDLHNEPDNYGPWKDKNDPEAALNWLARMTSAAKSIDPNHLFTLGPGRYESFDQQDSAGNSLFNLSDFISIHSYNARDLNNIIGRIKSKTTKPVILEEVGWPTGPVFSKDYSESSQLENYKLIVEAAKNQQVSGVVQWQLMDMLPYGIVNFDTFQDYFGLIRRNGALKPAAQVWRDDYKGTNLSAPSVTTNLAYTKQPLDSTPRPQYFPQTDHYVATPLKEFWRRAGGWQVFGYPITEAFSSDNGKTVIQYFEKARFEYYPERRFSPDYNNYDGIAKYLYLIDRGFLATEQTAGRNFPSGVRQEDGPNYRWFDQTKHGLAEPFYNFWQNHMGEELFGWPISEPFEETNPEDGGTHLVQYFARARLEYHPELAGTAYAVSVADLGTEQARARGWFNDANPGYGLPNPSSQLSVISNQSATDFADPAFQKTWERTDRVVAEGKAGRTWLWGEKPFQSAQEAYAEAPGSQRLVQYFDKSRMEITNPGGDKNSKWYVTNGLLVKELITGQMQVGDNQLTNLAPANIPVAGDPLESNPDAPTYASLTRLVGGRSQNRVGQVISDQLFKDGTVGQLAPDQAKTSKIAVYNQDTGHNIADAFWNFMTNTRGPLYENGQVVNGDVVDWTFSIGLPISEPYWTKAKVGGVEKEVLIQAFERRVLTYTPSNSPAFQVEMGNVGQHYYKWRYGSAPAQASPGADASVLNALGGLVWRREVKPEPGQTSALFYAPQAGEAAKAGILPASANWPASPASGPAVAYSATDQAGRFVARLNDLKGGDRAIGYGLAPALSQDGSKVAFSNFVGPWLLQLNILDLNSGAKQTVQGGVGLSSMWSPDSQHLAFVSFNNKQASVAVRGSGGDVKQLQNYDANGQAIANFNWSPDNRYLAYTVYQLGGRDGGIVVNSAEVWVADTNSGNAAKISDSAARPVFSPDGKVLAFLGWGKNNLQVADWNNGTASNLRTLAPAQGCRDECANVGTPTFSPDSKWLAVTAPTGGLSAVRLSDGAVANLTAPANATDRDPIWVRS
jgi:hypothetical protein